MKRAFLSAELKPFLLAPRDGERDDYYEQYLRLESTINTKFIPDFFSFKGDFYDLEQGCTVYEEFTELEVFSILFRVKLFEINAKNLPITEFLNFQLFDNFLGDKDRFTGFLERLLVPNGNPRLFPPNTFSLELWIKENGTDQGEKFYTFNNEEGLFENDPTPEEEEIINLNQEEPEEQISKEELQDYKIKGHFTEEEINKFFSFLYEENSWDKKPFLPKEEVMDIFKNGLIIPANPPAKKYQLNCDPRYPKKIIDYAIYIFFIRHSLTKRDKADFLRFFGSYIEDYKKALGFGIELSNLASNITGQKSTRSKISWNKYLPERFPL
ncbi:MAG: hypothetical protein ACYCOO_09475 [Chitinophagaceae bacterium]